MSKRSASIAIALTVALLLSSCFTNPMKGSGIVYENAEEHSIIGRSEAPDPTSFTPDFSGSDYTVIVEPTLHGESIMMKMATVGSGEGKSWKLMCDEGMGDYHQQAPNPLSYMIAGSAMNLLNQLTHEAIQMDLEIDDMNVEQRVTYRQPGLMTDDCYGFADVVTTSILIESDEPKDKIGELENRALASWETGEGYEFATPINSVMNVNGDHFEFHYATSGVITGTSSQVDGGAVFFIRPGQIHYWETDSVQGYALLFREDFILSASTSSAQNDAFDMIMFLAQSTALYLDDDGRRKADLICSRLKKEYEADDVYKEITLRAYLNILLAHFSRLNDNRSRISPEKLPLMQTFYRLVSENFINEKSVSFYAENMGMTVNSLIETIKSISGFSPGQVLRHELSLEARRLLVHTDLTAAEIAYKLKFEDPSYFSRFFKRETGITPSQFRKDLYHRG